MLNYVIGKKLDIMKIVDWRVEKEGVIDDNRLFDYKLLVIFVLDVEVVYDEDRLIEEKKFLIL